MQPKPPSIYDVVLRIFELRRRQHRCHSRKCKGPQDIHICTVWLCQRCYELACGAFEREQQHRQDRNTTEKPLP